MSFKLKSINEHRRIASPVVAPQALAWEQNQLWLSSRDSGELCRIRPDTCQVEEKLTAPGIPWAAVATPEKSYFTLGQGENDDRYVYSYTPENGFRNLFSCPDFTGSYLSFDGSHVYISQWYKHRILELDANGQVLRQIDVGAEICGHTIVDGTLYVLRGTEANGESWTIARKRLSDRRDNFGDIAVVPFAARSLTFDGDKFWSNHRAANEIISFSI